MELIEFWGALVCSSCEQIHPRGAIVCHTCKGSLSSFEEFLLEAFREEIMDDECENCERGVCTECEKVDPNNLPNLQFEPCKSCEFVEDNES